MDIKNLEFKVCIKFVNAMAVYEYTPNIHIHPTHRETLRNFEYLYILYVNSYISRYFIVLNSIHKLIF